MDEDQLFFSLLHVCFSMPADEKLAEPTARPWGSVVSLFLSFRKKGSDNSFGDTLVLKTSIFLRAKHLKVFNTVVFLETTVFLEYYSKILRYQTGPQSFTSAVLVAQWQVFFNIWHLAKYRRLVRASQTMLT
jgi:hypothetical protein